MGGGERSEDEGVWVDGGGRGVEVEGDGWRWGGSWLMGRRGAREMRGKTQVPYTRGVRAEGEDGGEVSGRRWSWGGRRRSGFREEMELMGKMAGRYQGGDGDEGADGGEASGRRWR